MPIIETDINIYTQYCSLEDGLRAVLSVSTDFDPGDPSVGVPAHWFVNSVELVTLDCGGEPLNRDEAIKAFGRAAIENAEEAKQEKIQEQYDLGNMDPEPDRVSEILEAAE